MSLFSMDSDNEHNLHVDYYSEAFNLFGNDCSIYQVLTKSRDLEHDPTMTYADPVPMCICFESNPKPILKKLGWYTEDEDLPYIAYVAFKDGHHQDVSIQDDTLIEVFGKTLNNEHSSKFIVTRVNGSKIHPLFWTVKLAPYRPTDQLNASVDTDGNDSTDSGYTYVKR